MKTYILLLLSLPFISGCSNNVNDETKEFEIPEFKISTLTAGFEKVPYGSVYAISYKSEGEITNNCQDIIAAPFLEMRIKLVLENGNIMSNNELDPAPFIIPSYRKLLQGQFMPQDVKRFNLSSPELKKEYTKYPISKVLITYVLSGNDPLKNQKEVGGLIRQIDVTKEWKTFTKDFDETSYTQSSTHNKSANNIDRESYNSRSTSSFEKPSAIYSLASKSSITMPQQVFAYSYKQLLDSFAQYHISYKKEKELAEEEFIGYKLETKTGEYFLTKSNVIGAYSYNSGDDINSVLNYFLNEQAKIESQEADYYLLKYQKYHIQLTNLGGSTEITLNKD